MSEANVSPGSEAFRAKFSRPTIDFKDNSDDTIYNKIDKLDKFRFSEGHPNLALYRCLCGSCLRVFAKQLRIRSGCKES